MCVLCSYVELNCVFTHILVRNYQLARQGLNIVLISRSKEKLNRVADEVEKLKRKTLVVSADLSAGPTVFKVIAERLNNLDIGILGTCTHT